MRAAADGPWPSGAWLQQGGELREVFEASQAVMVILLRLLVLPSGVKGDVHGIAPELQQIGRAHV